MKTPLLVIAGLIYVSCWSVSSQAVDALDADRLERSGREALEKYPELNDENSDISKRFKKVIAEYPEYLSVADGPVLIMRKVEEEMSFESRPAGAADAGSPDKDKLITYWYSILDADFKSRYPFKEFRAKLSAYSYEELKQHFQESEKSIQTK